jgi:two-component system, NtrC family, response regulator AtoC
MAHDAFRLLLVDDDLLAARVLGSNLARPGRMVTEIVASGEEALQRLERGGIDAIVTDLTMPGMDGIELARRVRALDRSLPIVVLTVNASIERAVDAIRAGANDFLQKPANVTVLQALIDRAVSERPVREELAARKERRGTARVDSLILGKHPRLDAVRAFAEQVADVSDARVLITGETGTGKSRLARAIHEISGTPGRFVEVNCAALPPTLLESELFGHERGAFTDARTMKRGLAELADRGTLFLDEIGGMPLELQAKLLLFIERREVRRVGGTEAIPARCRLITATHENLRQRVRDHGFRQDLLFRLDVASVEMPPLREMPSVIPELARAFVLELCDEFTRPTPELTDASFAQLPGHSWPGNMREVRNAVERALIFHREGPLMVFPPPGAETQIESGTGVLIPYGVGMDELERLYLRAMLQRHRDGELNELAAQLGISRKTLWEKRRRHQL